MSLERLASLIRQLQGALGGRSVRAGTATATWTADAVSAQATVTHGLPSTPSVVLVSSRNINTAYSVNGGSIGATTFGVLGFDTNAAVQTQTLTFDWIALA